MLGASWHGIDVMPVVDGSIADDRDRVDRSRARSPPPHTWAELTCARTRCDTPDNRTRG
jgi:hypothetical protein